MKSLKWILIVFASVVLMAGCSRSSNDQGEKSASQPAEQAAPAQSSQQNSRAQPAKSEMNAEQTASENEAAGQMAAGGEIEVYFVEPIDGSAVTSPVQVVMAAQGVKVVPAGTMEEGTGHMHIMVDAPFVKAGEVIPNDEHHIHYGDGSTEADLDLKPGKHTLRLEFADGEHKAYKGDQYRDTVHITVQAAPGSQDQEAGEGSEG